MTSAHVGRCTQRFTIGDCVFAAAPLAVLNSLHVGGCAVIHIAAPFLALAQVGALTLFGS